MTLQSTSNSIKINKNHMRAQGKIFLPMDLRCQNCYLKMFQREKSESASNKINS